MTSILSWERNLGRISDSLISPSFEHGELESFLFRKYFPKCIRELKLASADHSMVTKIKSIKRIPEINTSWLSYSCSKLRLILGKKLPFAKHLNNEFGSQKFFSDRVKLFPYLETISITIPYTPYDQFSLPKTNKKHLILACRMMKNLKDLKELKIKRLSIHQKDLIESLNSSPRLLAQLKSLKVFCRNENSGGICSGSRDLETAGTLARSKTLLKNITELDLDILCSNSGYDSFKNFMCPKLESLSFAFHCRSICYHCSRGTRIVGEPFQVEVNYLKTLETFQSLKSLKLHIADTLTFLTDFAAPPSLRELELVFEEQFPKEIMLKIDSGYSEAQEPKIFEENNIFMKLYEKFQHLGNIESLALLCTQKSDVENYKRQSYFIQALLKRMPEKLKRLELNSLSDRLCILESEENDDFPHWMFRKDADDEESYSKEKLIKDPYLPQILESCEHFSQALESLRIGSLKTVYSQLSLSSLHGKFPKLSKIEIARRFKRDFERQNEMLEFLSELIPLGDALKKIKLYASIENTHASCLLSILQQMSQLQRPERLKLELYITYPGLRSLKNSSFSSVIKELQGFPKVQGISVKLETGSGSEEMRGFLRLYGEKFESFQCS